MGTHPIFESDFDCLTDKNFRQKMAKSAHREGGWKQSNKTHKTGQHRSKGAIGNSVSGKIGKSGGSGKIKKKESKMSRKAAKIAFRTKKENLAIRAYRPLHMILFPLNHETDEIHSKIGEIGEKNDLVGTGYKINFEKNEFCVTWPNDVSSLLVQALVCDVIILYGRYDLEISDEA